MNTKPKIELNFTPPVSILLFITFFVMKVTGFINWSWWLVTMPLWAMPAFVLLVIIVTFIWVIIITTLRSK